MILSVGRTKFKLSFSFAALLVLMIILCEERIVIYSLACSLIHESGHLFFMYLSGDVPGKVVFTLFGIRIDRTDGGAVSYKKELLIAFGGIIFNTLFALVCLTAYCFTERSDFVIISAVNLIIAAVNSFPVSVLDCGRALHYAFLMRTSKEKSEKYSDTVSAVFTAAFTAVSLLYTVIIGFNISLVCINLYLIFITVIKKWS